MNHARISNSDRLKRVASVLKDGKPHSTMQIIRKAKVCAVNSICAELRANGLNIECQRKGDRWFYQMKRVA